MKYQINLLTRKKENSLDRAIYFSLNYFRYILVLTLVIVIGVFLVRFKIDQEIVDLQEAVTQKKEIVTVSKPLLTFAEAANIQGKHIEETFAKQTRSADEMDEVFNQFPKDLYLMKFSIEDDVITLDGVASNAETIKQFVARMKTNSKFELVELKSIRKTLDGFETTIQLGNFKSS